MNQPFRRDADIKPRPGTIIAEFTNGTDALAFSKLKGDGYTVTPGINHVYAVRVAIPYESMGLVGFTDRGKAAIPELARILERVLRNAP